MEYKYNRQRVNNTKLYLKKIIFPDIDDNKLNNIQIDQESYKFITFASTAEEITNIIMNSLYDFPCPQFINIEDWNTTSLINRMTCLVITEMTAGVGGNVLNFAKYFKYVNAIEIDKIRYNYLTNNVLLYKYENVNCYNNDSYNLLIEKDDIVQDIVFFDPPWGGSGYKKIEKIKLTFDKYSIENICRMLFERSTTKMVVLKLPNNYDFEYLRTELSIYKITKSVLDKITIVVVKNY